MRQKLNGISIQRVVHKCQGLHERFPTALAAAWFIQERIHLDEFETFVYSESRYLQCLKASVEIMKKPIIQRNHFGLQRRSFCSWWNAQLITEKVSIIEIFCKFIKWFVIYVDCSDCSVVFNYCWVVICIVTVAR